jgi:hypothetical protein
MALPKHKKNGPTARLLEYYLTPDQKVNAVNDFVQEIFSRRLKNQNQVKQILISSEEP